MSAADVVTQEQLAERESLNPLIDAAIDHEKWPVARLVSLFESEPASPAEKARVYLKRQAVLNRLIKHRNGQRALVVGITGTPGAGKSSLINEVSHRLLRADSKLSVAIIAVDPSSQVSGGALLGDRTRVRFANNDKRLFFRSQASHLELGGLGKKTFQAVRLLKLLFDVVIVETVGIGQSELEINQLSDITCLVLQPLTGDQVQFMKAGIMEVPNVFIVNKCDENELAQRSYHLLKSSLKLISISVDKEVKSSKPVFLTSALKQTGIDQLTDYLLEQKHSQEVYKDSSQQEDFFLRKWIRKQYGDYGIKVYNRLMPAAEDSLLASSSARLLPGAANLKQTPDNNAGKHKSLEQKEAEFNRIIDEMVRPLNDL